MFSYCNNNFINFDDRSGHGFFTALIFGTLALATYVVINTYTEYKKSQNEIKKVQDQNHNQISSVNQTFKKTLKTNSETVKKESESMNYVEKLQYFIENVETNGKFDLKNTPEWENITIYYDEHWMESQDIGNYHFGYIGRALGYSVEFLTLGAGLYQVYSRTSKIGYCLSTYSMCDDPRDTYYIRLGAIAYDNENR